RDRTVTGVQTCALPIFSNGRRAPTPSSEKTSKRKTLALDEAAAQAARLRARPLDAPSRRARVQLRRARRRERGGKRTRRAPRLGRACASARAAIGSLRRVGLPLPRARRIRAEARRKKRRGRRDDD